MAGRRSPWSPGLRARATLAWGLIALALSTGLATFAYQFTRERLVAEREDAATTSAYLNARLVRSALRAADPDLGAVLASLEANADSAVLLNLTGEWFSGSVGIGADVLPGSLADRVAEGDAGRQRFRIDGVAYVGVGVPLPAAEARYFELTTMEDVERTLSRLAEGLALGAVLATAVGAAAGWYASGRVLRPLRDFAVAAERVAEGELDTRLDPGGDPDLEVLDGAFNHMAGAVQERIDREARFTSDVSHELRAPVAALLSSLSIARREQETRGSSDGAIAELEDRVAGLNDLVEGLLEVSRADAGVARLQLDAVDPGQLAEAVLSQIGGDGSGGEVEVVVVGDAPGTVLLDKRRIGQSLQNLLENAERYAGGATRLEVCADGAAVRFAVEDRGTGVPEHERAAIFERFARGEAAARVPNVGGSGLGLSLVAEHARLHGGSVRVEDADGGGARFVIELPWRSP